jgi:hypothetical protein
MHADAEHHQHDADLGELAGEFGVRHEAGRERPDPDAGQEVTKDGGRRSRAATKPPRKAKASPTAMVAIRVTSWGTKSVLVESCRHLNS